MVQKVIVEKDGQRLDNSRAKYIPPNKLLLLIELTNDLPKNPLPLKAITNRDEPANNNEWLEDREKLLAYLKDSKKTYDYIEPPFTSLSDDSLRRYERLRKASEKLKFIAGFSARAFKLPGVIQNSRVNEPLVTKAIERVLHPYYWEELNSEIFFDLVDGRAVFIKQDLFCEAIENVEIHRIRLCEICGNVFWAQRIDRFACSDNCRNTLKQRRFEKRFQENKPQYMAARKKKRKPVKAKIKK